MKLTTLSYQILLRSNCHVYQVVVVFHIFHRDNLVKGYIQFVTVKYFALNKSWAKARQAYMKTYEVKNIQDAPSQWVIFKAVKSSVKRDVFLGRNE